MNWAGRTVICVASGPSLTIEDCRLAESSGYPIIAVNSSWPMVPRCSAIYASDYAWWQKNVSKITIPAERWTNNAKAEKEFGCRRHIGASGLNSGLAAIHVVAAAERILLLAYDCQPMNGQDHWHGPHKGNNPNQISYLIWAKQFRQVRKPLRDKVINCSRQTAIKVFQRMPLEGALNIAHQRSNASSEYGIA